MPRSPKRAVFFRLRLKPHTNGRVNDKLGELVFTDIAVCWTLRESASLMRGVEIRMDLGILHHSDVE